ncbi:MAG: flavodoxin family protein [Burkholderiales bacterium]
MKIIAYNASPRKQWNTAMLLESALKGAATAGAETQLIHLYDIDYTGCQSCFECKRKGGKNYGRCALRDGLSPILESIKEADAAIFGSPVYFGNVTGALRSFLERLWFPYLIYTDREDKSLFPRRLNTLFVYTTHDTQSALKTAGIYKTLSGNEHISNMLLKGESASYYCTETLQFSDYSKYVYDILDENERIRRRREVFPLQLIELFELGRKLAENI